MYCIGCGADNIEGSAHCIRCGHDLRTLRTDVYTKPAASQSSVILWSPDVAALLSIPFSPIFGAIIHALNWRRLGQRRREMSAWLWAAAILFSLVVVSIYGVKAQLDESAKDGIYRLQQLLTLVLWYFGAARGQGKYVVRVMRNEYRRESWFVPICVAIIFVGAFLGLAGSLR